MIESIIAGGAVVVIVAGAAVAAVALGALMYVLVRIVFAISL